MPNESVARGGPAAGPVAGPASDLLSGETPLSAPGLLAVALREYLAAADMFEEAMAAKLGLSRIELRCLDLLERRGTMTPGSLAEASGLSTGAITFLLDRLEKAAVVVRRRDTQDRRRVLVDVVPEAAQLASDMHEPMVQDMRAVASRISDEGMRAICTFLHESRQVYEAHAPRLAGNDVRPKWE